MNLTNELTPVLFSGEWGNEVMWEFYGSNIVPELHLCTAVFCLPFQSSKILLVDNFHRSWEIPGGHIEKSDQTIISALERELLEEAKVSVTNPELIGYRKIIAKNQQKNEQNGGHYPFPISYIPHYMAEISIIHDFENQHEIRQRDFFSKAVAILALQGDSLH
mgnify:FL=1